MGCPKLEAAGQAVPSHLEVAGAASDSQTCTVSPPGSILSAFTEHTQVQSPLSHIVVSVPSLRP